MTKIEKLPDEEARRAALTDIERSFLVEAGAGSGKTSIIAGRVAVLLARGKEPKRIAAITFGPKNVLILVGRNKIVPDLERAMLRIKEYAAPANAMRLEKKTPCVKTGICEECTSPSRICNTWTITQKSFPRNRIIVVLINRDMGL